MGPLLLTLAKWIKDPLHSFYTGPAVINIHVDQLFVAIIIDSFFNQTEEDDKKRMAAKLLAHRITNTLTTFTSYLPLSC